MGEYYEKKPLKIRTKRKKRINMVKFQMFLKNNENITRKKPTKAQTMTVESSKAKTTIIHPRQRKKIHNKKWWKTIQNCCYQQNLTLIFKF